MGERFFKNLLAFESGVRHAELNHHKWTKTSSKTARTMVSFNDVKIWEASDGATPKVFKKKTK